MKTTIRIPVVDTESGRFEYDGQLTREQYGEMEYDQFRRTNRQVQNYVDYLDGRYGAAPFKPRMVEYKEDEHVADIKYTYTEAEAIILDANGRDIDVEGIRSHNNGKMFILIFDINPESIDYDGSAELRYWMWDSDKVLNDREIDRKTGFQMLPYFNFTILVTEGDGENRKTVQEISLKNCKMVANYSSKQKLYKFAIKIEKMEI